MLKKIISCLFTILILLVLSNKYVYADDASDLQKKISDYEKKISQLRSQEKTLQNQIDLLDDQISLIQLKIQAAEKSITEKQQQLSVLQDDITDLSGKIVKLGNAVSYQTLLYNQRVRARYMDGAITPLEFLFSDGLSGIVQKAEYLRAVEEQDLKIIDRLKDTKKNYEDQKTLLEEKKAQVEKVKAAIEVEKAKSVSLRSDLQSQKSEKAALLTQTQGSEAKYQELLASAKAELDAINGAISATNFTNGEKVKKGDFIAVMGNSGAPYCSTGAHLHFEVHKNGGLVNAENYLKPKTVFVYDYSTGTKKIGSGNWDWPMTDPTVTQRYGRTPWSYRYSPPSHTGVDMVDANKRIFAPADGTFVRGTVGCYGARMNYAAIDHGGGVVSHYFHIQ